MARVERVDTQGFLTFISMPLLTELVSIKDGFSYKHGAPNGAVPKSNSSENSAGPNPAGSSWVPIAPSCRTHRGGQPLQSEAHNAKNAPGSAICGVLPNRPAPTGRVTSCTQATTQNMPTPPKRQPLLGGVGMFWVVACVQEVTLPVGAGRFGRTPHIALSGAFLALRASDCNG